MYKLRIKFQKVNQLKFISHLELMRVIERAFRRMQLPLKFTQGFNPHPKISYAAPLSVGVSSDCEFLDVELTEKVDISQLIEQSKNELPTGITFLEGHYVVDKKSLMSITAFSLYAVQVKSDTIDESFCRKQIESFMNRQEILHTKLNKRKKEVTKNIRDLILDFELLGIQEGKLIFKMLLKTGSSGNVKPETVLTHFMELQGVQLTPESIRVHRLELYAEADGKPIPIFDIH